MTKEQKQKYIQRIKEALDIIRPYLQKDNGDVELVELTDDMIVKVRLLGSCKHCKYKGETLRFGIERQIRSAVPAVKKVIEIE